MDEFVYKATSDYFHALEKLGYLSKDKVDSLLVLLFYYNLIYKDYRGFIKEEHYHIIEKALNCLYGVNCLIPYPDYLKMGKLKLGEMTEIISRINALANLEVEGTTVQVTELLERLDTVETTEVVKGNNEGTSISDIVLDS